MPTLQSLEDVWARLRQGFWFLPSVIVVVFALLAVGAIQLDQGFGGETGIPRTFDGDAEASRSILSAIAAGFITVVGVAFSITIVTLQLVSSQYSPLTLATFLGDRLNQATVGTFVGIVVYCLLTLRVIRSGGESAGREVFVPGLAVTGAIAAALLGLGLLIVFIHHLSTSIQVTAIAERVGNDVLRAVDTLYPEQFGAPGDDEADAALARWGSDAPPELVRARRAGYVRSVDVNAIAGVIGEDARAHVRVRPGEFVTPNDRIVALWPAGPGEGERADAVRRAVVIDSERSLTHDVGFGLRQLADIALRALSPSLNDPTSAGTCIGYLRADYEALAGRAYPERLRRLAEEGPVLVVEVTSFAEHLSHLEEVARHARREPQVLQAVRDTLDAVEDAAREAGAAEHAAAAAGLRARLAAPDELP